MSLPSTSQEDEKEGSSIVTLSIQPQGNGCRAKIVHRMNEKYAQYIERTERGWGGMLKQIGVLLIAS